MFASSVSVGFTVHFWMVLLITMAFLALISLNLNRAKKTWDELANVKLLKIQECMGFENLPYLVAKTP